MIAAEMTGRSCLGLEVSPTYVDIVVTRWQAFTGQTATWRVTGAALRRSKRKHFKGERGRKQCRLLRPGDAR